MPRRSWPTILSLRSRSAHHVTFQILGTLSLRAKAKAKAKAKVRRRSPPVRIRTPQNRLHPASQF